MEPREEGEYLTDREADEAVGFIRRNSHKPFFLNMTPYAVHFPIMAMQDMIDKYEANSPSAEHKNATYAAMLESVDQAVGKILNTLRELKI